MDWGLAKVLGEPRRAPAARPIPTSGWPPRSCSARDYGRLGDAGRQRAGDAGLHGPRAGHRGDRPGRRAERRVRAGGDPGGDPDRPAAVRRRRRREHARAGGPREGRGLLRPAGRLRGRARAGGALQAVPEPRARGPAGGRRARSRRRWPVCGPRPRSGPARPSSTGCGPRGTEPGPRPRRGPAAEAAGAARRGRRGPRCSWSSAAGVAGGPEPGRGAPGRRRPRGERGAGARRAARVAGRGDRRSASWPRRTRPPGSGSRPRPPSPSPKAAIAGVGDAGLSARVREKAASVRSGLARARRDAALLAALEAADGADFGHGRRASDQRASVRAYRAAFEAAGLPADGDAATLAAAVRAERPGLRTPCCGPSIAGPSPAQPARPGRRPGEGDGRSRGPRPDPQGDPRRRGEGRQAGPGPAGRAAGGGGPATRPRPWLLGRALRETRNLHGRRPHPPAGAGPHPSDPWLLMFGSASLELCVAPATRSSSRRPSAARGPMVAAHPKNAFSHYQLGQAYDFGKNDPSPPNRITSRPWN